MSSKEHKESLERYRANDYPIVPGPPQKLIDCLTLADAYLAENDPTPISPEWCASVFGPPDTDSCHVITLAEGGVITVYPHLKNVDICDRENNTLWDMDNPSRGALLKLLAALGIQTKE